MRSGSEAGSGRVRRSADAAQSPFSTADPLVPFYTATHQVVLLLQPQQDTGHTHMGPIGRERGEMRGKDRKGDRKRGNKSLGRMQKGDGVQGKITVWAAATLVTDQIGRDVYQSAGEISAKI